MGKNEKVCYISFLLLFAVASIWADVILSWYFAVVERQFLAETHLTHMIPRLFVCGVGSDLLAVMLHKRWPKWRSWIELFTLTYIYEEEIDEEDRIYKYTAPFEYNDSLIETP